MSLREKEADVNFLWTPLCFYWFARWLNFLPIESISWNTSSSLFKVLNFKSKCYLVWPKKEKKQLLKTVSISWCVHTAATLVQHFNRTNAFSLSGSPKTVSIDLALLCVRGIILLCQGSDSAVPDCNRLFCDKESGTRGAVFFINYAADNLFNSDLRFMQSALMEAIVQKCFWYQSLFKASLH